MESINPMDTESKGSEEKKPPKLVDRVTLGKAEAEKVDRWLRQISEASKGFLSLSRSDVVNFLIRDHREDLIPKELVQIRSDHYDPIRHIHWITPQLKAALAKNDIARVAELQEELRGVELSVIKSATNGAPIRSARTRGGARKERKRVSETDQENAESSGFSAISDNKNDDEFSIPSLDFDRK